MSETTPKKRWLRADRIVLIAIFCVAGVGFIPVQKICDDGDAPLTVTIHSTSDSTIRAASAEAFSNADDAQYAVETKLPPTSKTRSASQDPFTEAPLTVHEWTSRTGLSGLWWTYPMRYSQGKFVVVIA